jgi:tetratricopeptide (TPR) repeat protein
VIAIYAGRTHVRNTAWQDNLALASADVTRSPRSFRTHEMLAQALHERDPRGNLDAAIREEERAWEIVNALPAREIPVSTPMNLGGYYLEKADVSGPEWYEKALAILLRGSEISRLQERDWDELQRAHGRPLRGRWAAPNLYFNLGQAYGSLGRYQEALEAHRFGRAIDPGQMQFYDPMAAAYTAMGQPTQAMVTGEEKRVVQGGDTRDCDAFTDLAAAYDEARQLERASEMRRRAQTCAGR